MLSSEVVVAIVSIVGFLFVIGFFVLAMRYWRERRTNDNLVDADWRRRIKVKEDLNEDQRVQITELKVWVEFWKKETAEWKKTAGELKGSAEHATMAEEMALRAEAMHKAEIERFRVALDQLASVVSFVDKDQVSRQQLVIKLDELSAQIELIVHPL